MRAQAGSDAQIHFPEKRCPRARRRGGPGPSVAMPRCGEAGFGCPGGCDNLYLFLNRKLS